MASDSDSADFLGPIPKPSAASGSATPGANDADSCDEVSEASSRPEGEGGKPPSRASDTVHLLTSRARDGKARQGKRQLVTGLIAAAETFCEEVNKTHNKHSAVALRVKRGGKAGVSFSVTKRKTEIGTNGENITQSNYITDDGDLKIAFSKISGTNDVACRPCYGWTQALNSCWRMLRNDTQAPQ
jgi:hypothetical protein